MIYVTVRQSPRYYQMSLEEYLFQDYCKPAVSNDNTINTKTYEVESASEVFSKDLDVDALIGKLAAFNKSVDGLRGFSRQSLYRTFHIPKKTGGLRRIDAPNQELMAALYGLKSILESDFHALYHTSAFAYIQKRSTIAAVQRHQQNESRWFGKFDLHNFFGSTTLDFVMHMLSVIFPFSEVMKSPEGEDELRAALELGFLNGGLPQGTPLSPMLTNLVMIPIDFSLTRKLRNDREHPFVNTRYADDFIVSSKYAFNVKDVERMLVDTLAEFGAPFTINSSKTRYGSSAGRNWNLGVMLNANNEITVGHRNKRRLQSMLHNFIMDSKNGIEWDKGDVSSMQGTISYYRMVEKDTIDAIIRHIDDKMGVDVERMIRDCLR